MIGVVAGVGPYAGLDMLQKILEETVATRDQDHVPVLSLSAPAAIPDRTAFLQGRVDINPGDPLLSQLLLLAQAGATVAGIPCNTAHAPAIWDKLCSGLEASATPLKLLNMIAELASTLRDRYPQRRRVGVLSTTGTRDSNVYRLTLEPLGFEVLAPEDRLQHDYVQAAIYNPAYGIKACGKKTARARDDLLHAARVLAEEGAQVLILGCTEIPLAITEPVLDDMLVVDPTRILARALIREIDANKLRPAPAVTGSDSR